jgi:hypothetical protein
MELKFQFSRHLLSCNNVTEGKLFTDFEPSATIDGIYKTILFSINNKSYNFNKIYVSNLLRTWITATLMYGSNIKKTDTLTLYISPYLKERHFFFWKRGNYPKEIQHMVQKFLFFLENLHKLCTIPTEEIDDKESFGEIKGKWYENLPNKIVLVIPESQKILFSKTGNLQYILQTDSCKLEDTSGPKTLQKGFLENGNLEKFMEWFPSEENYYGQNFDKNNIVHVVTHGLVMAYYLKPRGYDKNKEQPIPTNIWRFVTAANEKSIFDKTSVVTGILEKKSDAKNLEATFRKKYKISLCGIMGSVKNPCSARGGRNTRRKLKRRY